MAHSFDITGYTYKADTYCVECITDMVIESIEGGQRFDGIPVDGHGWPHVKSWVNRMMKLRSSTEVALKLLAGHCGINYRDAYAYDTDEFPKVIFVEKVHGGEGPDYCGKCHRLLFYYDCEVCGECHGESAHGDPVAMFDHGHRTWDEMFDVQIGEMAYCAEHPRGRVVLSKWRQVLNEYNWFRFLEKHDEDQNMESYVDFYDEFEDIAREAGYVVYNNSDGGVWCIYTEADPVDVVGVL